MKRILLGILLLPAGCWCPCEVHGTTLPLQQQQQCAEQPKSEVGPSSQPTPAPAPTQKKPEQKPAQPAAK